MLQWQAGLIATSLLPAPGLIAAAAEPPRLVLQITVDAPRTASLPDTRLMRAILRNLHSERSGDIYVVFDPNVFITDFDGLTVASTHRSPWRYDTFVPVIFAGAGP